jgi:hypothetical protein
VAAQVLVAPLMLAEDAQRLSDGLVKSLRADVDGVLEALRMAAGDLAGADGHGLKLSSYLLFAIKLEPMFSVI